MMDNNLEKYAAVEFKETANKATMTVTIPKMNPRKSIPPLVFNRVDAEQLAEQKYGSRFVAVTSGDTLENRPGIHRLETSFTIELTPKKTTTKRTRTAKTTTTKLNK
jgi:hypothetical protein